MRWLFACRIRKCERAQKPHAICSIRGWLGGWAVRMNTNERIVRLADVDWICERNECLPHGICVLNEEYPFFCWRSRMNAGEFLADVRTKWIATEFSRMRMAESLWCSVTEFSVVMLGYVREFNVRTQLQIAPKVDKGRMIQLDHTELLLSLAQEFMWHFVLRNIMQIVITRTHKAIRCILCTIIIGISIRMANFWNLIIICMYSTYDISNSNVSVLLRFRTGWLCDAKMLSSMNANFVNSVRPPPHNKRGT